MQLNIDLLPKTKSKSSKMIVFIGLLIILLLTCSIYGSYQYLETKQALKLMEERLEDKSAALKQLEQDFEAAKTEITADNYASYYQQLYTFLATLYADPVVLYHTLVEQLPAQAKIDSFAYQHDGEVSLEGSFLSIGDIAMYQQQLNHNSIVQDAYVAKIEADEEDMSYKATIEAVIRTLTGDQHE